MTYKNHLRWGPAEVAELITDRETMTYAALAKKHEVSPMRIYQVLEKERYRVEIEKWK